MARPYLGRGAAVGFGKETTWGTAVAATIWMGLISESMTRGLEKKPRPTLAEASGSANRRGHYTGLDRVGGSIAVECTYEGFLLLIEQTFGAVASTTGPSGGLYTHTMLLSATPQIGLTVYVNKGQGTTEVFEGCKVSKMTFKIAAGEIGVCEFELIGETSDGRAGTSAPSWTGSRDLFVKHNQVGTVSFNSATYTVKSFEISIDCKVVRRDLLGSANTAEPVVGDFAEITFKSELEYFSDALFTAMQADTQGDLVVALAGPASRAMTWTVQNAYMTSFSDPVSGPGVIMQSATWQGESDGTDEGLKLVCVNTQATATAA